MAVELDDLQQTTIWPLHRFSVQQYHQLGDFGILSAEDSVELLDGLIVRKMNQRPIHGFIVRVLNEMVQQQLPTGWLCQCQLPITAASSEPEPDLAVISGEHESFRDRHPSGTDCRLVVEVADTSLAKDRGKVKIYQAAGVAAYWIVNVAERCLEAYDFQAGDSPPAVLTADQQATFQCGETVVAVPLDKLFE